VIVDSQQTSQSSQNRPFVLFLAFVVGARLGVLGAGRLHGLPHTIKRATIHHIMRLWTGSFWYDRPPGGVIVHGVGPCPGQGSTPRGARPWPTQPYVIRSIQSMPMPMRHLPQIYDSISVSRARVGLDPFRVLGLTSGKPSKAHAMTNNKQLPL
jgi:hypothetical protein